jgi:sugar fermentation stimulation protein A
MYIAVFHLPERQRIRVGQLGCFWFKPGLYLYVGSAKRNLTARIERHGRKDKPLRWHIDYLSVHAQMIGAMLVPDGRVPECELAVELAHLYELAASGFGSSDCRCVGHLFYAAGL